MFAARLERFSLSLRELTLRRKYERAAADAKVGTISKEDFSRGTSEFVAATDEILERRRYLSYRSLARTAHRLYILPPAISIEALSEPFIDENWERLRTTTGEYVLKPHAMRQLRTEIRDELKARRDYLLGWISPFVGIIAAIAGVVAGYFLGSRK